MKKNSVNNQGEIILYQTSDNHTALEVRFEGETIWLTQSQIVTLFSTSKANVSEHITQIYQSKELEVDATVRKFRTVQIEGNRKVSRRIDHYNHDRFLIVDEKIIYHIGASLKDLGKKWFAFSKIDINPELLIKELKTSN